MKMTSGVALVLLLAVASPASAAEVSPIGKIVQLISDLQAKVTAEGEAAQKVYSEFAEWCEDRSKDLGHEIKTGKAEVETLTATISEETSESAALNTKIEELAASIASNDGDLKAATDIRTKENADFVAEEKELMEVIGMLERAVGILEREMAKSGSFLQSKSVNTLADALTVMVQASLIGSADASKLTAFMQSSANSDEDETGAPAGATYEGHSGNIVDTLEGLMDKAKTQLDAARSTEEKSAQQFAMLKQSLTDEIEFATKDMDAAKSGLASSAEKKSTAEGDLATTSKDLSTDIQAKADLHQECMTKSEDFESETKSRGEELKALATAKKVIIEATGGAEAKTYGSSFLQISSKSDLTVLEVVRHVRDLSHKIRAPALAQLAQRLSAVAHMKNADVFGKIKGLIGDMIEKLEKEAEEDATKDAYCQKEMSETKAKKEDKETQVKKLTTKIDQMAAKSASLKEEISELQASVAALRSSTSEADKIRAEESAAFKQNSADLNLGLEGVKKALQVLTEYYAKDDKAHSSADGAGAGIIGLLEVCESDFSKDLAEITAVEQTAQATYEQMTKDSELELTMKTQDVTYKTKESKSLDKSVGETSSDRSTVQVELDAILDYWSKIQDECVAKAEPYAEIKARREAEISGLKEALTILESETALVQTSRRTLRGTKKHLA